jgi:hypothetical protein
MKLLLTCAALSLLSWSTAQGGDWQTYSTYEPPWRYSQSWQAGQNYTRHLDRDHYYQGGTFRGYRGQRGEYYTEWHHGNQGWERGRSREIYYGD